MNSVEIEQVENGYIVAISKLKEEIYIFQTPESFFDSFKQMISYIKFYFNVKEEVTEKITSGCCQAVKASGLSRKTAKDEAQAASGET